MASAAPPSDDSAKHELALWLQDLLEKAALSKRELARDVGVDRRQVLRWLDGSVEPGGAVLLQLLDALGIEITPKPPDQMPRPLSVELAAVRERVEAVEAVVVEQGVVLRDISVLLTGGREAPSSELPEQNTRP